MLKEYTCIACPRGCDIEAVIEGGDIVSVEGATCEKGRKYVEQELTDPYRNVATSVLVRNGNSPLASVRLTKPVPKARIFAVLGEIGKATLTAPVAMGQIVVRNVLGLGSDVIATKHIQTAERAEEDA
jgi:CxxC motif-containing protein